MKTLLLEIKNLHINYGSNKALNGLNMEIQKDSICAFVGSNGAGKTTTFSAIANFIKPNQGSIKINNINHLKYKRNGGLIGLLPQDVSFFEDRTIFSQLLLMARLSGLNIDKAKSGVNEILDIVELNEYSNKFPSSLSRGMKVRLGIAQAILANPPLILLDEPFAGLDPLRRKQILNLINNLKKHSTFIISSHELNELEDLCDTICIIENGKILEQSSMNNFLNSQKSILYKIDILSFPHEQFKNTFIDLKYSFNKNSKTLKVLLNNNNIDNKELNNNILLWLINNKIDILEMSQKSSLKQTYLNQIKDINDKN